ncbi:transposase [Thiocapsa imhoffii]|uniref:transposase n=1 Tax=Thiocapsa imhoffii TaxID=382777 RepID=UPI0019064408
MAIDSEVRALGWRWVGRVRGRDFVRLTSRWTSCKTLFGRATATPTALGEGEWVRSNPLRAVFALVRRAPKGRRGKTAFGRRARSKASTQNARSAKEPWLLVASTRFAAWPATRLVRLYAQRMQIELSFRDMKSQHFGEGLECSASRGTERFTVLVLIASLAAVLLWLIGTAVERAGIHRRLHPGNGKRRVYSRIFLARLLLVLDSTRDVLDEVLTTIAPPDQWVASDHDGLLADGAGGG